MSLPADRCPPQPLSSRPATDRANAYHASPMTATSGYRLATWLVARCEDPAGLEDLDPYSSDVTAMRSRCPPEDGSESHPTCCFWLWAIGFSLRQLAGLEATGLHDRCTLRQAAVAPQGVDLRSGGRHSSPLRRGVAAVVCVLGVLRLRPVVRDVCHAYAFARGARSL